MAIFGTILSALNIASSLKGNNRRDTINAAVTNARNNNFSSIAAKASEGILQFPVIISDSISYEAAVMTAMLKNVINGGTGAAANIGKPAAGKTGTTDDYKDASFIGYTPNVVTGVWVGNDDNTVNPKSIQGGTVPALIWRDIMKVATAPYKNADFDYPEVKLIETKPKAEPKQEPEQAEAQNQETEQPQQTQEVNPAAKPALTPADVVKNFKQSKTDAEKSNPQPQPQTQQQQAPVNEIQKAPVPIPMAVPESLH